VLSRPGSELFVPDAGVSAETALARTTHLGIGAHADDLEILAIHGILAAFAAPDRWFTGVVMTDGVGSPGGGPVRDHAQIREIRRCEQKEAAVLGRYGAVVLLDHSSQAVKDPTDQSVVADLALLLRATRPEVVYTHALSDAHDTHVAVTLRLLAACRELAPAERPARVLGCEVWRDLDWLAPSDRVTLAVDDHEDLQAALIAVFASQIEAGKRYDRAVLGRRHANAVFSESHAVDRHRAVVRAMDLTPLAAGGDPADFVAGLVQKLELDSVNRIARLAPKSGLG
jgi:LmbE family N-acetylglucosaminyl deacetylase